MSDRLCTGSSPCSPTASPWGPGGREGTASQTSWSTGWSEGTTILRSKPETSSPLKIWTVLSPRNLNSPLPSKPELSSPLFSTRLLFSDGRESLRWWFERFYETQWATSQTLKRYCGEEEFRQEGWSKVVLLQWTSTVPTSKPGTLMTKAETVIAGKLDDPLGTN